MATVEDRASMLKEIDSISDIILNNHSLGIPLNEFWGGSSHLVGQ